MRRFHVHVHVDDLDHNVRFYSAMFGAEPVRREADYAKWMLEDPAVNFAISTFGSDRGIGHLGIQVDDDTDLATLKQRAAAAEQAGAKKVVAEGEVSCCYARSDKHWVVDPQGIAWEHFRTLRDIPVYEARGSLGPTSSASAPSSTASSPAACGSAAPGGARCCG